MDKNDLDPRALDLAHLGLFAGMAVNAAVRSSLEAKGFTGLRDSHGFIVQHLLRGPHSVGELAKLLGVSQQAVSKSVGELSRNGYVSDAASDDGRVRKLRLSSRGRAAVRASRAVRGELETQLRHRAGDAAFEQARTVLLLALEQLNALEPIRKRKVKP